MKFYTEREWPKCDVIVSNPPFLGDKFMRRELGDDYVEELRKIYDNRIPGQSDLCCYWFEKARELIEKKKCERAGLLATQGIRGGANRVVLKRIKETGDIFLLKAHVIGFWQVQMFTSVWWGLMPPKSRIEFSTGN